MEALWYWLVSILIAGYVILDGFDLGAGAIHLFVARTDEERRQVLRSIGPVWDGNEVWLLAAGGSLFLAFPAVYASSFSGFYLPLMMVLWLLMLRGISIEFRNHINDELWKPFWDVVFSISSLLLIVFFGAALGNVVRGVPLDAEGVFFEALWTDFRVGPETGILDWYTVLVALTAVAALVHHGALYLVLKTEGAVRRRAHTAARAAWVPALLLTVIMSILTFRVQSHIPLRFAASPWLALIPAIALGGLVASLLLRVRGKEGASFLCSCVYLIALLSAAAAGLFPNLLPAIGDGTLSLTAHNSAASPYALRVGLFWWIPGMLLASGYFVFLYRKFAGKVTVGGDAHY